MDSPTLREAVTDAIKYWEPRRLLYNALLAGIVLFYLFYFLKANPSLKQSLTDLQSVIRKICGSIGWQR